MAQEIKDFLPLLVALLSSIFAYILGKASEKNKRYSEMADESLEAFYSEMYKEVIEITNYKNYNVKKIKGFIMRHSSMSNIYKIYDDNLLMSILSISKKIRLNTITNEELKKEFFMISIKIENLYWYRVKVVLKNFDDWMIGTTRNRWYGLTFQIFKRISDISEYLAIIMALISFLCIMDKISNGSEGLFNEDIRGLVISITGIFLVVYICFKAGYWILSNKEIKSRESLIKKL